MPFPGRWLDTAEAAFFWDFWLKLLPGVPALASFKDRL